MSNKEIDTEYLCAEIGNIRDLCKAYLHDCDNRLQEWMNGNNGRGCMSAETFYIVTFNEALKNLEDAIRENQHKKSCKKQLDSCIESLDSLENGGDGYNSGVCDAINVLEDLVIIDF